MKIVQVGASGHYEYALAAAKREGCDFVGLCMGDRHEKNTASEKLSEYGFTPEIYGDYAKMLEETNADIVIVNSFMGHNADFAAEALRRGKHVFAEKPIATDFESLCHVMREYRTANSPKRLSATKSGRVCLCGMFGILDESAFMTARKIILSGTLGDIRLINAQKSYKLGEREEFYSDRKLYGGTIPWVSIHAIDWAWRLFGLRFSEVYACHSREANGDNGSLEASAICLFKGTSGEMVSVSADYLRPAGAPTHGDDRIRAVGTGGILEIRGGRVYLTDAAGEREVSHYEEKGDIFAEFLSEIKTGKPGRVSALGSFYSTYLALAARESADTGNVFPLDFDAFCLRI